MQKQKPKKKRANFSAVFLSPFILQRTRVCQHCEGLRPSVGRLRPTPPITPPHLSVLSRKVIQGISKDAT